MMMTRPMPQTDRLPHALYTAAQVREFDRLAIQDYGIPGAELMERAGTASYRLLRRLWPEARDITLVCGLGNNAGDGYVVARLALADGLGVRVRQLGDRDRLRGDALTMALAYDQAGGEVLPFTGLPSRTDVIVDAILGTGLERPLTGLWAEAIQAINRHPAPVLAIDIPSGLDSDRGQVLGIAVEAEATISFIGLKLGLFVGTGPDHCGDIYFDALGVPARVYSHELLSAKRLDWEQQSSLLTPRRRTAHKGDFGHVLVVGGAQGMGGAARLAAEAAARTGAGLVSLATWPGHAAALTMTRPEIMTKGVEAPADLDPLLQRATQIVLGPGLGQDAWGRSLWSRVLETDRPLVIDADGLNLLGNTPRHRDDWVLTPHPGEAARLLGLTTAAVQADRFAAALALRQRFGGLVVLKGAGTLIQGPDVRPPGVCSQGNPGMASGGMGDVLAGIIGGLAAQGFDLQTSAEMGVCLHGAAADRAAARGERGLLAGDLLAELRSLLNPEIHS